MTDEICCRARLYIQLMGGDESKTSELQDDYYILQHLSKMSLQNRKTVSYYFISPAHDHSLSQMLTELRQYFKLDHFPAIKTLKQEMTFVNKQQLVKAIVTDSLPNEDMAYLQNQPKIAQIIVFGSPRQGKKIAGNAKDTPALIKLLNTLEEKDALSIPASNVLLMIDQDTKILNKYRLNYHCSTNFLSNSTAKKDFLDVSRALLPQHAAQIEQFEKEYDASLSGPERRKIILDWAFKDGFYWEIIHRLTRNTTDPKRLAYVRLAIKDLYEAISEQYKANKPKQPSFFIMLDINEEQQSKFEKLQKAYESQEKHPKNFLLFSSFVKGTIDEKQCVAQKKRNPNSFRFLVNIYNAQIPQKLDFGYVIRGTKVLVNIYNVFQLEFVKTKIKRSELLYGVLPINDQKRQLEKHRLQMTKPQLDLTRNYDYLQDLMSKVDSQATLLQLSGYFKQSLQIYDKKVDFIRRTNESDQTQTMNRCLIKKADALTFNGEYEAAQKQYLAVVTKSQVIKAISLIHLAQLYMRQGDEAKLEKTVEQFQPLLPLLQKQQKQKEQFYKGSHFLVLKTLKKGSAKKAEQKIKIIITSASNTYKHNLEGKPVMHDIWRTLAACQSKQGRHDEALKLLNETRSFQLACEGKTHNLALTQTLIQSVSRSSGKHQQQLSKSIERMEELSTEISSNEARLQSPVMIGLSQSMVKIDV